MLTEIGIQWSPYKADTIRSKKTVSTLWKCPLYRKFSLKLDYFVKYGNRINICYQIALSFTQKENKNKNNELEDFTYDITFFS